MRIGELAARAGASTRQVRFYEACGLITSSREANNNYRHYDETALGRVQQIRELLNAGLSTRTIKAVLPCLDLPQQPILFEGVTPETVVILERERDRLSERIDILTRNRDAVADYLAKLRRLATSDEQGENW